MFRKLILSSAIVVLGGCASAMSGPPETAGAPATPYQGAFARSYPEASALFSAFDVAHASLLERLYKERGAGGQPSEDASYNQLLARVNQPGAATTIRAAMPSLSQLSPRLAQILDRAHQLNLDLYDIYSDGSVTDKNAAVDAAVDWYLSGGASALPGQPKSMDIMAAQHFSGAFKERFPKANGLMWASHWLELAASDPLLVYRTPDQQKQGLDVTLARFREMLADAPGSMPQQMPTPPAISPELTRRHQRAAAIFDNVHMLQDVVADILVNNDVTDKRAAIDQAISAFADPHQFAVTEFDWLLMSLRMGIYEQGGPAIGRLSKTERNKDHVNYDVPAEFLPGMSTMGAPDIIEGVSPEHGPGAVDHTNH